MGEMGTWDSHIGPWLLGAILFFAIYRRVRRQFGPQPIRPVRMALRLVLLLALGGALCPLALASPRLGFGMLAALVAGVGLGAWAAAHTRVERSGGGVQYVPHLYAGLAVTALVIGRVAYRLVIAPGRLAAAAAPPADLTDAIAANPTTLALLFVLVGYYLCYYGRVLIRARQIVEAEEAARPADERETP